MRIFATFTFEAAHRLPHVPEGHKCGRLHGHSWTVEIHCAGEPDEHTGMIVDYYDVEMAWDARVYRALDHRLLNDVPGLDNPTTERIAEWIWAQLCRDVPSLCRVVVRETPAFGCIYDGPGQP
jgi:6-pyruvoyltetrahydropterin/6-carboxytetrahydropterin synthase